MNLNSFRLFRAQYQAPPVPEGLCSHVELADLLLHYLQHEAAKSRPPVTDEGIHLLFKLAFFTSMAPEEGRFPRFNIACQDDFGALTRFAPISLDTVEAFRRLAPACTHSECALLASQRDGRLWCDGVVNVGPVGDDALPGRPEFDSGGSRPSVQISIVGPGHLIARCGIMAYELREGKIRYLTDFWRVPPMKSFREQLAATLEQQLVEGRGKKSASLFGGCRGSLPINTVLSRMLRVAVQSRHGGAFVILPTDTCDSEPFDIHLKYAAQELDLGLHMKEFWGTCAEAYGLNAGDGYNKVISTWTHRKANMLLAAEAVGHLSCVDGCVVLNRRLQLCGFGGEIQVPDQAAKSAPRRFTNYKTGDEWEYGAFLKTIGGTRHRSAARLCRMHEGVMAFVVSQDGELKVFASEGDKVNAFGPLDVMRPPVEKA